MISPIEVIKLFLYPVNNLCRICIDLYKICSKFMIMLTNYRSRKRASLKPQTTNLFRSMFSLQVFPRGKSPNLQVLLIA